MCVCVFVGAFVCLSVCMYAIRILYRCAFFVFVGVHVSD